MGATAPSGRVVGTGGGGRVWGGVLGTAGASHFCAGGGAESSLICCRAACSETVSDTLSAAGYVRAAGSCCAGCAARAGSGAGGGCAGCSSMYS